MQSSSVDGFIGMDDGRVGELLERGEKANENSAGKRFCEKWMRSIESLKDCLRV